MNQRDTQCALKGERANVHPFTLETPLMRLSVASLRRVVKRNLPIEFVPQQLTSYGGSELLRRYLQQIDLSGRLGRALGRLGRDYGNARLGLLGLVLFYVGGRKRLAAETRPSSTTAPPDDRIGPTRASLGDRAFGQHLGQRAPGTASRECSARNTCRHEGIGSGRKHIIPCDDLTSIPDGT
jgi:hypothetical protein